MKAYMKGGRIHEPIAETISVIIQLILWGSVAFWLWWDLREDEGPVWMLAAIGVLCALSLLFLVCVAIHEVVAKKRRVE